ncbi:MAG: hypothetical protein HRT44_05770 [Bdellovibrionales bacterium]|nr:hypothetical protein [Bdellovibrionales bacterium]NQZ18752.1 hypothetical protein [Bdellovibrionales bacterium]
MNKALYWLISVVLLVSCSNDYIPSRPDDNNDITPTNTQTHEVQVSTFNVKWFGIGGTMWNRPENEFRQNMLRQFIKQELSGSDIIGFTEVVRTDALKEMLKGMYDCVTYEGSWSRHQHVVICFNPKKYRVEKYDDDYIVKDVDLGSGGLRPAAQAKICHLNGDCFLQFLVVHLVAGNKTERRLKQVRALRDELLTHTETLPTVLVGDFNSYRKERTGLDKDDIELFTDVLHETDYKFKSVTVGIPTFWSGPYAKDYDHIMITPDIESNKQFGYMACEDKQDLSKEFIPFRSFSRYFSDHCPVSAQLKITTKQKVL